MPRATIVTFGSRGRRGRQWLLDSFCISDVLDALAYPANRHLNVSVDRCHGDGTKDECKRLLLAYPGVNEIIAALCANIESNYCLLAGLHFGYFIQCTAGVSRSVALAQLVAEYLVASNRGWEVFTVHLDAKTSYAQGFTFSGIDTIENLGEDDYEEIVEIPITNTIQQARTILNSV